MFLATDLWKYVNDTTISQTIRKKKESYIQAAVDILANRASVDNFFNLTRRHARNCV